MLPTWPLILGQAAIAVGGDHQSDGVPMAVMLLPLALVGLVVVVPVVLGIRADRYKKELEHAERMRALELGRPLPGDAGWWTPARMAMGLGGGVPIGVFGIAWLAATSTESAAPFIWPSAGAVGLAAVICGTVLAARLPSHRPIAPDPHRKPYVDPDAYDAAEHQHA